MNFGLEAQAAAQPDDALLDNEREKERRAATSSVATADGLSLSLDSPPPSNKQGATGMEISP